MVDAQKDPCTPHGWTRRGHRRFPALGLASVLLAGCGPPPGPPPGPAIDAREVSLLREQSTQLDAPVRAVFDWRINEGGARFSGQGVARFEPPYRARLDLFLGNGELVVQAALVDDELRLPPGAPEGLVPPAPLLWAALGVFRPGRLSTLLGGEAVDTSAVRLRYRIPQGGEAHFVLDSEQVMEAELLRGGRVEETMEIGPAQDLDVPGRAVYRNLPAFRELHVEVETVDVVESFPPEIWEIG